MDHSIDRRKRESSKLVHEAFYTEPRQNGNMDNNLRNKRRRTGAIDCDKFLDIDEAPGTVDVLTSRRMRILLREKPWHNYIDCEANPTKGRAPVLSTKNRQELQEFKEQQQNIQLQMANEAFSHWEKWCSSYTNPLDSSITLKKLIEFIGTKVIPQENAVLRQLAQSNLIPISGVESLLLPLLRHLDQKEEKLLAKKISQSNHSQAPLMVSIRTGACASSQASLVKPSDSCSSLYSNNRNCGYITIVDQVAIKIGSEVDDDEDDDDDEEEVSPWTSVRPIHEQSPDTVVSPPSAVLDDVSCLENSLEIVSTITAEVESFRNGASMPTIDFTESNPYLLTESFFSRLRKDQAKAERLGLSGMLYNSLLVDVLQEHVQLVQTLSIQMSNRVISLIPTSLVKNPASPKDSSASHFVVPNLLYQESYPISLSSPATPKPAYDQTLKIRPVIDNKTTIPSSVSFEGKGWDQSTKSWESGMPRATSLATAPFSKSKAEGHIDKVKTDDDSIQLIWQRWRFGEDGMQPLKELVNRQGTDKMVLALRTYCTVAYYLSNEIERLCGKGMDVDSAIECLETRRRLSLPALAMIICQEEEQRREDEERAISGFIQQPSILSKSDIGLLSANASSSAIEKNLDTVTSSGRSKADPLKEPVLGLSQVGQSLPLPMQISSAFDLGPSNDRSNLAQQSAKIDKTSQMVTSVTSSVPTTLLSGLLETLPGMSEIVPPIESSVGSLRSTFKALTAMNTTKSALGPAFTQLRPSMQSMTKHQGAQDPLPLPGSLAISYAGLTQPSAAVASPIGPIPTTTPTLLETSVSTTHQSITPPSSSLLSVQSASDLHVQAMSSLSMPSGSSGKVYQSPSALATPAAPTARPLISVPLRPISNYSTFTTRNPQPSSAHIHAQPQTLQQQQPPSDLISRTPALLASVHSTPTFASLNGLSTSRTINNGPGPGSSTLAVSQGVLQLLNAAALRGTTLTANPTTVTSITALSHAPTYTAQGTQTTSSEVLSTPPLAAKETSTATAAVTTTTTTTTTTAAVAATPTSPSQTPATVQQFESQGTAPTPYLLQVKDIETSQATLPAVSQEAPGVAVLSPSTSFAAWGQYVADGLKEQIQLYRLNLELKTVYEIWDLWMLGIHGRPSVTDLIGKHKMEWLHHTDREIYRDYRSVLLTLERTVRLLKIDVRVGLARLEKIRVDFKMSVRQFAQVLTEVDAGKIPTGSSLASSPSNRYPETMQDFAAAIAGLTLSQLR